MNLLRLSIPAAALLVSFRLLAAPAGAPEPSPPLSPEMRAPDGERLAYVLAARGVQIYACRVSPTDAHAYQWVFVAPEATLSENGTIVGHHGAGPVWESTSDGSAVKGAVRAKQDGGKGNIAWLLLAGQSGSTQGRFSGVTSVQRVATKGGTEPALACDSARVGEEARIPYTAEYRFFKRG